MRYPGMLRLRPVGTGQVQGGKAGVIWFRMQVAPAVKFKGAISIHTFTLIIDERTHIDLSEQDNYYSSINRIMARHEGIENSGNG